MPAVGRLLGDADRGADLTPGHPDADRVGGKLGLDRVELPSQLTECLELPSGVAARNDPDDQCLYL